MFQLPHLLSLPSYLQELNINVEKVKWSSFAEPFEARCLHSGARRDATGWGPPRICELVPPSADCLPTPLSPWPQIIKGRGCFPPSVGLMLFPMSEAMTVKSRELLDTGCSHQPQPHGASGWHSSTAVFPLWICPMGRSATQVLH